MLAADKLQLQSQIKQSATALKEKEFSLHHNNLMTVGTQAAVLAGLDITMFVEFHPPEVHEFVHLSPTLARLLLLAYYGLIVAAFCSNMVVVSHTTTLSVLGGSLALRGPDGSMMTATDCLFEERRAVFAVFGMGLTLTMGSVLVGVWVLLQWEAALLTCVVAAFACRIMWRNYCRVRAAFQYNEDETVDLRDLFEGVASIRAIPTRLYQRPSSSASRKAAAHYSTSKASSLSVDDDDMDEDDDDDDNEYDEEDHDDTDGIKRQQRGYRSSLSMSALLSNHRGGGGTNNYSRVKRRAAAASALATGASTGSGRAARDALPPPPADSFLTV
jgi:hypothetical protein